MKRPALAILIGKAHHDEDEQHEERDDDEKMDVAKDVLRAIKEDDPEMLVSALDAYCDLHYSEREDDEEPEDQGDEAEDEKDDRNY